MIYAAAGQPPRAFLEMWLHAFFCNRTTLVHFFSSRPSYFLRVASSNVSPIPSSSRNAAALLGRLHADKYAIIDL